MSRQPFPLQWPDGWPRTPDDQREGSRFHSWSGHGKTTVSLVEACRDALDELVRLGAEEVTITSNLPTKSNGLPYATGPRVSDPGIAVWWTQDGKEQVIACDRWESPAENLRAIAKTLDAIRGIARWGSSSIVSRALSGFAALPPPAGDESATSRPEPELPEPDRSWMEYFHVTEAASRRGVQSMFRTFAKQMHPDRTRGDSQPMAELNVAWSAAQVWFDWRDTITGTQEDS